ncbi:prevent-host-death protein [Paraburkholderia ginsengiterrae]|uniref:Prevent-host-death protein n=1 Tax=Paraburkholderia ginsengiterrae TaxID=1462993 RepID=A0A1A9NDW3_9BURK|nr:YlcI/YnfO family protein [Paraburkholderia ginsengiterrae]OAJ60771.1 prevent-host-death protein [Paraburkholderia ginsengiterrae]OAJ64328.1 prevent-host-death protein [Paraburkholderia ginsengiterrae]
MTTTILTLRVDPELRMAAEGVLRKNESLPEFMDSALREGIARRRVQNGFISRGLASAKQAGRDNEYFSADDVLSELERRLTAARNSLR